MNDSPLDYARDVPYLRTFSNDLSPSSIRLTVALNGFTPPPEQDFDYLELGCGNGDTLTTLAAMYPRGRFVGVDLSAEHVAFAEGLARRGGLDNVRFLQTDFETLSPHDVPPLDYVALYGVLSWISPAARGAALRLAGARLKPGGALFASYNAMPGWAAVQPLRRLMQDAAAGGTGTSLDRAHRGVSVAKLLAEAGAGYFQHNPSARTMLQTVLEMGLHYAVHEYFLADWHPFYFEDLARELAAEGLHFAGEQPLFLNYRDLAIPASLRPLFEGVTDRVAFESLKDYALNQFFRRDVYLKGGGPSARSDRRTRDFLEETRFSTLVPREAVRREITLPSYALHLQGPVFDALVPALAHQGATATELATSRACGTFTKAALGDAILQLLLGEQIVPLLHEVPALRAAPLARLRLPLLHNRMVLAEPLSAAHPIVLASPATGRGVVLPLLEAVCLRALTETEPAGRDAWLRDFVAHHPVKLHVGTDALESPEAQLDVLSNEVDVFVEQRLPKLLQLGVLEVSGQ